MIAIVVLFKCSLMLLWDSQKAHLIHMFDKVKEEKGVEFDTDLTADDLKEVVEIYKEEYKKHAGVDFPQDPKVQMMEAIKAVFRSWNNDRAIYL